MDNTIFIENDKKSKIKKVEPIDYSSNDIGTLKIIAITNAKDFIKNSKDYVNDIVKSDDFKNAKKKAEDLGNNIKDKLQDEGLWDKIVNAIKDIFNSIANLFK